MNDDSDQSGDAEQRSDQPQNQQSAADRDQEQSQNETPPQQSGSIGGSSQGQSEQPQSNPNQFQDQQQPGAPPNAQQNQGQGPQQGYQQQPRGPPTDIGAGVREQHLFTQSRLARKSRGIAALLGFFLSPAGYIYLGNWKLAAINFLTFNYLLTGFIVVPIHTWVMIGDAREDLRAAGITSEGTPNRSTIQQAARQQNQQLPNFSGNPAGTGSGTNEAAAGANTADVSLNGKGPTYVAWAVGVIFALASLGALISVSPAVLPYALGAAVVLPATRPYIQTAVNENTDADIVLSRNIIIGVGLAALVIGGALTPITLI